MTSIVTTAGPTFLRRPRGAEYVADALRVLTLISIPVAAIGWGAVAFAVMALSLLGVVVPRVLGLRPGFDIVLCLLALVAGWSSVLEWYTTVFGWDKLIHFLLIGALSILVVVIGADVGVLPDLGRLPLVALVVLAGTAGLAIGGVWEMCEWVGHTHLDSSIYVGYDDTIGDLAADTAGAVASGFLVRWSAADRRVTAVRGSAPGSGAR
ncbi:hypothetical protein EDF24_0472 [Curtobacterium sp. PhB130]|uniref:hypothetical protein n=1 Tax=unclassified Curtobacterium TaxID=257496 RepID=UPI000F4C6E46|nr:MULTISPECIES: hypothetical protein [unclassified Curtobacterium]ROP63448.1 hypothetical protein EDF55_2202 [Curtobacterium sp. ZW137]ROS77713.1 hypothetical protein EDF24_0472 [Curtobacterium sp. PhB130]